MRLSLNTILILITCLVVGFGLGFGFGGCSKSQPSEPVVLHDTLTIRDTIRLKGELRYITKDSIRVERDSIHDTTYVYVDREHREWSDSIVNDSTRIRWTLQYSGIKPRLDGFDMDYTFTAKPKVVTNKQGWGQSVGLGVGPAAGVFAAPDGRLYFGGGLVFALTYQFGYHW